MPEFTRNELMVVAAAKELGDGEIIFVGIGIPMLASIFAQMTHAPNLLMLTESGVVGAAPKRLAFSIADPCLVYGTASVCSTIELFSTYLQRGRVDVGFLGGAQVDKYGNLNSTVVGPYEKPSVRFPGSGGACEIASLAKRTVIIMPQGKRRFIERVEFITSPGFVEGGTSRKDLGIPGGGPAVCVTDMGVYRFDPETKEMYLETIHPGVTVDMVKDATGWDIKIASDLRETPAPSEDELRVVRAIDPTAHFLSAEA